MPGAAEVAGAREVSGVIEVSGRQEYGVRLLHGQHDGRVPPRPPPPRRVGHEGMVLVEAGEVEDVGVAVLA
ncbi:hypothetical protein GBF35_31720 [Nonomuraea phyllanthi]|uniref:hypothetical protein n=1 Tax=Nonomuraea phyllanthi TaxID=2219224 RepID=UPI0012933315|nr:hypothetical protein [Nonomuraea phyllanthi]QFY10571.1 hypothetical protein GBF35_31720 [Nonomuraea phyllanthi]